MPIYRLPDEHVFPHPSLAEPDGLLAIGGDLHPHRLMLGYASAIFPWYSERQPILWFSPDPRFVLYPERLRVARSLRKRVKQGRYEITMDTAFAEVIRRCKVTRRPRQRGTWITRDMEAAYIALHQQGFAHSVEAWQDGVLVGGLYGVSLGTLFSGESMFAREPDASKVAFVWLVRQLARWGFELIDCQVHTDHLERFGAEHIPRARYLEGLRRMKVQRPRAAPWRFSDDLDPLGE